MDLGSASVLTGIREHGMCQMVFIFSTEARAQAREPGGRVGPKGTSGLSQGNYFFYFVDLKGINNYYGIL